MKKLKEGDIITLKSGGPKMTIEIIKDDKAFCKWFSGSNLNSDWFKLLILEYQGDNRVIINVIAPSSGISEDKTSN
jgi:uncharacterized protein YodC (DUF2158 family)